MEYLLWWVEGFAVPPLVTTSPEGTDRGNAGVLGLPTTSILAGESNLAGDARSGGRVVVDYWFDPCQTAGVHASYWGLGRGVSRELFDVADYPILARPFFNVERGLEGQDADLIAFPDWVDGSVEVTGESTMQGVEVLWRRALANPCGARIDLVAGWRFNRLDELLRIHDFRTIVNPQTGLTEGTTLDRFDEFATRNWFHGAEVGIIGQVYRCPWTVELVMKLALGNTHSRAAISGSTTVTVPVQGQDPDVATTPAGLLAQSTNIGLYETDQFTVVPELGLTLGYDLTYRLRATVGYTFMYWSRVARPGEQVDFDLNLTQLDDGGLVGNPRPRFTWVPGHLWAQGLSFGLDYRF